MTSNQRLFLSGFFESRGSIDTQRNFLTLDYFFHSPLEFKKFHYLIDFFNIPSEALNFNFRELQPEYAQGINQRNAQFRIYLDWYLYHIGLFNPYRARIAEHVFKTTLVDDGIYYKLRNRPTTEYRGNSFIERAHFYLKSVYQQDLDDKSIEKLREQLGWIQESEEFRRDSKIINFIAFQRLMFATHVVVIMTLKKGVLFLYLCIKSLKIPIPTTLKSIM